MTKKSDKPTGTSFSEEFKEISRRLRSKEQELDAVIEASEKDDRGGKATDEEEKANGKPGRGRTVEKDASDA